MRACIRIRLEGLATRLVDGALKVNLMHSDMPD